LIIPSGTVFTSNPTPYGTSSESTGGTPPANVAFISGTVGYRRHSQGHTDVPEWPVFVTFASKYMSDVRPVITPGQVFTIPASSSTVGEVAGTPGGGGNIANWQVTGGTGAYIFDIDPATGTITIPNRQALNGGSSYTLTLLASDGILPTHQTTVNLNPPAVVAGTVQLVATTTWVQLGGGGYQGTVTVTNTGTGTAKNVVLGSSTLGTAAGSPTSTPLISIPPSGFAVTTLTFPASAGAPSSMAVEKLSGTYTGGTFGGSTRVILP
jgi:hypothetical protein